MPLHPKQDFEIIREIFDWIRNEGIAYEEYSMQWKKQLAEEIRQMIEIFENKKVKFESVYRNINRMISYYEQTGAQARSGKRYLRHLEFIMKEKFQRALTVAQMMGGGVAQRFLTIEDARAYAGDIPEVLKIYFDPETKLWVVLRYPSKPLS
jgi:hypothetical protein